MTETTTQALLLEIVSDTICPWCYIGKQKLDAALNIIGDEIDFDVRWRPFELNPDMPRQGLDRKQYRSAKFGSWEKSLVLDAQVHEAGEAAGLDFHHDRMEKTPNTLSSHVLVRLALDAGLQNSVVDAIFKAYFTDGLDVGDVDVLAGIGASCGMNRDRAAQMLADDGLRYNVKAEATAFSEAGMNSVPSIMRNRHLLLNGAQAPERIADTLRRASANEDIIAAGTAGMAHG